MACAMPGVTWHSMMPGRPVMRAEPMAAPRAMFSCRHSMYVTPFDATSVPSMIGISFVPGTPKM